MPVRYQQSSVTEKGVSRQCPKKGLSRLFWRQFTALVHDKTLFIGLLIGITCCFTASHGEILTFYYIEGSYTTESPRSLYQYDTIRKSVTQRMVITNAARLGSFAVRPSDHAVFAAEFLDYNVNNGLYLVDLNTGGLTLIGHPGTNLYFLSLAFDPVNSQLYGIGYSLKSPSPWDGSVALYRVNPTNASPTLVKQLSDGFNIAFDSGGKLYGVDNIYNGNYFQLLYQIDKSTGTAALMSGRTPLLNTVSSCTFSCDGLLYSMDPWGNVYQTNPQTGVGARIGNTGISNGFMSVFLDPFPDPPAILAQPLLQVVTAGNTAAFNVSANCTWPRGYQWRFNGTALEGETNATLVINHVQPFNAGNYRVVITNAFGAVTSDVATLSVRCSLNLTVTGDGTITRNPNAPDYQANSTVTLTATPAPASPYRFFGWSGDASGRTNPMVIQMTTNKYIQAQFANTTVYPVIQGEGVVSKVPDKTAYEIDEEVTLIATPQRWFAFTSWADGPTNNPRTITIGLNNNYSAIFSSTTAVETLTFLGKTRTAPFGMPALFVDGEFVTTDAMTRLGAAAVTIQTTFPNGIILYTRDGSKPDMFSSLYTTPIQVWRSTVIRALAYNADFTQFWECDPLALTIQPVYTFNASSAGGGTVQWSPSNGPYPENTIIAVTAQSAPGWSFLQWLGDLARTGAVSHATMTRNLQSKAIFGTTLSTTVTGGGMVLANPAAGLYPFGYRVRLTAVPEAGQGFVLWGNAVSSTNNPLYMAITNANPVVSCLFAPLETGQVTLTVVEDGLGRVDVAPRANRYPTGQSVTLTAISEADQSFVGWSGDVNGTNSTVVVSLNQSKTVNANFTKRPRLALWPGAGNGGVPEISILLDGVLSELFVLEYSANLDTWTVLTPVTNRWGTVQFLDAASQQTGRRYYRAHHE